MPVDATQQSQSALISQPPSSTQVTSNGGDNIAGSYLNNGNGNGGGGKQRTNLMARTAASQNLPPYPKGHYCYSSTTKNSLKANNDSHKAIMRSPKHRLLQVCIVFFLIIKDTKLTSAMVLVVFCPVLEIWVYFGSNVPS